jgi:hypothetical protein
MTAPLEPYGLYVDQETGMAQLHALEMARKLGEHARERELRLIRTFWRLIWALGVIIFFLAVLS